MPRLALILSCLTLLATPARAEGFVPVTEKGQFLQLVEGRVLSLSTFGIRLAVRGDGVIEGQALGWPVNGQWAWKDGLFCRQMDWSGRQIPYNCQLVELGARGGPSLRFTVDGGKGRSAVFALE